MTTLDLNKIVSYSLRAGVLASASLSLLGLLLWAATGSPTLGSESLSLYQIIGSSLTVNASRIVYLAVVVLIATPIFRVAVSSLYFAAEKDQVYVGITLVVLVMLVSLAIESRKALSGINLRISLVTGGVVIVIVGYLLDYAGFLSFIFTVPIGLLNIFLGGITPKNQGVVLSSDPSSPVKLFVDKGVVGSNTYALVFLDGKLVLKKLSSALLTVVIPLILTIGGLVVTGSLIGAVICGMTGIALQEYVTQRRRDRIKRLDQLTTPTIADLEFPYGQLEKVEISRSRLYLFLSGRVVRINISRRYSKQMRPVLGSIISTKYQVDD